MILFKCAGAFLQRRCCWWLKLMKHSWETSNKFCNGDNSCFFFFFYWIYIIFKVLKAYSQSSSSLSYWDWSWNKELPFYQVNFFQYVHGGVLTHFVWCWFSVVPLTSCYHTTCLFNKEESETVLVKVNKMDEQHIWHRDQTVKERSLETHPGCGQSQTDYSLLENF